MKRKKVILAYNPKSGNGLFKNNLDTIVKAFQKKGYMIIPIRMDKKGILDEFFSKMNQEECAKIIAAGGDGTINIVVNAMIKADYHVPLAIFPAGTANDFAYYFDIPTDIDKMIEVAMSNKHTKADVGVVNGRYFVNVAAMGSLVDVSQKTDPNLKNTLGVLSYYLKGAGEITKLKPMSVTVESNEFSGTVDIYFMLVMNGRSAGGFKKVSPKSSINDGKLDVMMFKAAHLMELPQVLFKVLAGQHQESKDVIFFQTDKLRLDTDVDMGTDIDGEKGEKFPLDISVLPNRLEICTIVDDVGEKLWNIKI